MIEKKLACASRGLGRAKNCKVNRVWIKLRKKYSKIDIVSARASKTTESDVYVLFSLIIATLMHPVRCWPLSRDQSFGEKKKKGTRVSFVA